MSGSGQSTGILQGLRSNKMFYKVLTGFTSVTGFQLWILLECNAVHFSSAFKVPPHNSAIYMTKLFSMRVFLQFVATIINYFINNFLPFKLRDLSTFYLGMLVLIRFLLIVLTHVSNDLAFHAYIAHVWEGLFFGFFFNSLFPLLGDAVGDARLCFGISGFILSLMQMTWDKFIFHAHMVIARIILWFSFVCFFITFFAWSIYLYFPYQDSSPSGGSSGAAGGDQYTKLVAEVGKFACLNFKKYNYRIKRKVMQKDPSLVEHFLNAFTPFMTLFFANILKNLCLPGLIPFAFLNGNQFHIVFNSISPIYLVGSLLVITFEKVDPKFSGKWPWYYKMVWLVLVPLVTIDITAYFVMHTKIPFFQAFRGSVWKVNALNMVFFFCMSIIQGSSYSGLYHHVRRDDFSLSQSAVYLQLLHTLMDSGTIFSFCAVSVGYMTYFRSLEFRIREFHPTYNLGFLPSVLHWAKKSVFLGFLDFIRDFKVNIRDYLD